MSGFWKRGDDLERRLRDERPAPRADFMESLTAKVESPRRRRTPLRLGVAAGVSIAMVVALGAFGGFSYAASSLHHAAHAVSIIAAFHHGKPKPKNNDQSSSQGTSNDQSSSQGTSNDQSSSQGTSNDQSSSQVTSNNESSAEGQYGDTEQVCVVEPNGTQHTIRLPKKAVAAYLATHPRSHAGACSEGQSGGTEQVCVVEPNGSQHTVTMAKNAVAAYLAAHPRSHIGACTG